MPALHTADQELLHKLLLGQLPTVEIERLAAEYADDGRLAELAESLAGKNDALLDLLYHHEVGVVDPEGERLVERLLERLKPVIPVQLRDDTAAMNKADVTTQPSSPDLAAPAPKLPERLEYYRPIKVLGQGGMGTVYLAEDTRLGREVAIKTLRPELAINPQAKERFLREARTAAKLEHDNVIPIYSVGEADGTPFLAMPLLKGEPLDALIRRTAGPLPVTTVVRIAREAASGLAAAHERGLIHRDIKPANIWLEAPTGRVKILDFGLAKAADAGGDADSETHLTASGAIVGTPAYMAPEQASGHPVDGRADLFSLGCVLYELLSGKRAFSGPNTMSILMSLANHTPTAPDKLSDQCPATLSRLVMRLLEKDPTKRPASAEAVIRSLDSMSIENATTLQASRGASAPGLSQDATHVTGRTPRDTDSLSGTALAAGTSPTITDLERPVASAKPLTASDSNLTLAATEVLPVRKRAIPKQRVAIALAGVLLMLLAAVVYRIQTDNGTLVVTIDDPAVQAILEPDGLVIRDKHSDRIWTIKVTEKQKQLPSGKYEIGDKQNLSLLVTTDDGAEITSDEFTLKRKGERRVRVVLEQFQRLAGQSGGETKPVAGTGWPVDTPKPAIAPFDAAQAKAHQEAWAKHLGTVVEMTNSVGAKMVLIPPGEFLMGSTDEQIAAALKAAEKFGADKTTKDRIGGGERPQHRVVITKPYWLGATEVTVGQFKKFASATSDQTEAEKIQIAEKAFRPTYLNPGYTVAEDSPAATVTWNDATAYCKWLSEQEKAIYRLPTEAEWEYACRAGTTTEYSFGDDDADLSKYSWDAENSKSGAHPVATLLPNPFGLFDMHGNLYEWCQDYFDDKWYEKSSPNDPIGPFIGTRRSVRGSFWYFKRFTFRTAARGGHDASTRGGNIGFRIVRVLDAKATTASVTPQSPAATPDRRAAEWMLSIGGTPVIKENGQERKVAAVGDLPHGAFELTRVDLWGHPKVNDAGLAHFEGCKNILVLNIGGTQVTDAAMAYFQQCKQLTDIVLNMTAVSDAGLVHLKDCKNLIYLELGHLRVSDAGLAHFKDCKNLGRLFLGGTRVSDAGLAYFKDCKNLWEIELWSTRVSDAGLADLASLPRPSSSIVKLQDTRISLRGYEQLKAVQPKSEIAWSETNRSVAESVLALGGAVEIGSLDGAESRTIKVVTDLPGDYFQVRRVSLAGVAKPLGELPQTMSRLHFSEYDRLEIIDLSGITGLDYGFLAPIHGLQELSLANAGLNDESLAKLPKLRTLKRLVLDGNEINGRELASLNEQPELIDLSLGCPSLVDLTSKNLAELKKIKRLSLVGSGLTDAAIKHVASLTNLESLDLRRSKITATGIDELKAALPKCKIEWEVRPGQ